MQMDTFISKLGTACAFIPANKDLTKNWKQKTMLQALRIAATGMQAQQTNVDVLSNNIANVNTTAFKELSAGFSDLMYSNRIGVGSVTSSAGTIAPTGAQIGLGVNVGSVYKLMTQGSIQLTDNTFDLAVQGDGFFAVSDPEGDTIYTRDGSFQVDNTGQLVTREGFAVDPNITIPENATNVTISGTGIVSASVDNTTTELGTITLATFVNDTGLENIGDNYYRETEASGTATTGDAGVDGVGSILQGALEGSNVDAITSVTELITAQRAYELNSRVISTVDEMLTAINQIS